MILSTPTVTISNFDKLKMVFSDILVFTDSNKLDANLYRKGTDRKSILHGQSFHSTPLKEADCFSIRSQPPHLQTSSQFRSSTQKRALKNNKTNKNVIQRHKAILIMFFKWSTLTTLPESRVNRGFRYSPLAKTFECIIQKHWHVTDSDPALKCSAPNANLVVLYNYVYLYGGVCVKYCIYNEFLFMLYIYSQDQNLKRMIKVWSLEDQHASLCLWINTLLRSACRLLQQKS